MKFLPILFILFCLASGCSQLGAGTLGSFPEVEFNVPYKMLVKRFEGFKQQYTEYNLPVKWEQHDNWDARGYSFLNGKVFYFKSDPEEMYYVSFIGDPDEFAESTHCSMAIRSVFTESKDWESYDDLSDLEKKRIQKRFEEEIVVKLK